MRFRDLMHHIVLRVRAHARPDADYHDMDEELRYHLEREMERRMTNGATPAEARAAAHRALGNHGATHEAARDAVRWAWLGRLQRDCAFAVRSLRKVPVFSLGVVGTIAIALGLNTAVFTLFDAYVLRPLDVHDPRSLQGVIVRWHDADGGDGADWMLDWDRYRAIADESGAVAGAIAYRRAFARLEEVPTVGQLVSTNYFSTLGVSTILGRPIVPADAPAPGTGAVVVLSHAAWLARWHGDSSVVGRITTLNGRPFTVIGVTPPTFTGVTEVPADFWAPVSMAAIVDGTAPAGHSATWPQVSVIARLRSGVAPAQAADAIGTLLTAASRASGDARRVTGVRLESRATRIPWDNELLMVVTPIAAAFVLVLVIACANVANMMLARGLARQRELGVRLALGAGRRQIVAQLLTESFMLAVPAAVLGYAISRVALAVSADAMLASIPASFAPYMRLVPLAPDLTVFCFLLLAAAGAAVLFGLMPALQATRTDLVSATRGEVAENGRSGRVRNALVIAQVAAAVLLTVVAGVAVRGSATARHIDPGFDVSGLLNVEIASTSREVVLAALRSRADVTNIEAAGTVPARGGFAITSGGLPGAAEERGLYVNTVTPGYFAALHMPMRVGRTFTDEEVIKHTPVVVLSETAARDLAPGRSAVGLDVRLAASDGDLRDLGISPFRTARVVGVVRDAAPGIILVRPSTAIAYYPTLVDSAASVIVAVRGSTDAVAREITRDLGRAFPGAMRDVTPLSEFVAGQTYPLRAASWIGGMLGALALLLTFSGIYGVLACLVAQRTREIGIRMSLGARPVTVVAMVVRQTLRLAVLGGAIGMVVALGVSRLYASTALVVSAVDGIAYAGAAGVALVACLLAAFVPARRAAAVDPLTALRAE